MFKLPKGATIEHSTHHMGGNQWIVKFANGLGASIVDGWFAYRDSKHPYELAVLAKDGHIDYKSGLTNDVVGHLNEKEVNAFLRKINALK